MAVAIGWCAGLTIGVLLGMTATFLAVFYAISRTVIGQPARAGRKTTHNG